MNNIYRAHHIIIHTFYRLSCVQWKFFPHRLRMSVSYSEAGAYVPTFSRFRIPLRRPRSHEPSSRPPYRPSRVPSRQAGTAAEEANEKVCLESRKGPRSAESTRISTPSMTRFWICYIYLNKSNKIMRWVRCDDCAHTNNPLYGKQKNDSGRRVSTDWSIPRIL